MAMQYPECEQLLIMTNGQRRAGLFAGGEPTRQLPACVVDLHIWSKRATEI